jgi:hypothetical protein
MKQTGHTLSIVIPALNEEAAIGSTIERCLEARAEIIEGSGVASVEIIVVSDGSTDRTEEIARGYPDVAVLAFERNRGYGAAIKCGFEFGRGDLLAFLDADGTCDPRVFAALCRAIDEQDADVVLGSRMGPGSEMPWTRSLGNLLFASLLGVLSKHSVRDTASGMRVVRRASLADLYPLPDGLHFTPAMSGRVLLEDKLELVEVPMPYAERLGQSKLSVIRDGLRFFQVIAQAAMCYRPARPLLILAAALGVLTLVVGSGPASFYLGRGRLEEWMVYRILFSALLATIVALLVCAAVVAEHIAAAAYERPAAAAGLTGWIARLFTPRSRRLGGAALTAAAVFVAWPGMVEYATSGQVEMHWSRAVLASLLLVVAAMLGITTFLLNMVGLIRARRGPTEALRPPDRIRRVAAAPS